MKQDPRKEVTNVRVEPHQGEIRVVLEMGDKVLFIETPRLSAAQAGIVGSGYIDGLTTGGGLSAEMIMVLVNDPQEIAALFVPLEIKLADRPLFKRGMVSALRLAAEGYWLDCDIGPATAATPLRIFQRPDTEILEIL